MKKKYNSKEEGKGKKETKKDPLHLAPPPFRAQRMKNTRPGRARMPATSREPNLF